MSVPAVCGVRLRTQLDCLPLILSGVEPGSLENRPGSGKWSARENLAHLARYQEVFLTRLKRISTEDRPQLDRYRAEDDPEWRSWIAMPAGQVFERLHQLRLEMVAYIEHLSDEELSRSGHHSQFGEMTLVQWLEFFLLHEAHHLFVVMRRVRE
jgi:uncharacterized damage-inducible protein DinB